MKVSVLGYSRHNNLEAHQIRSISAAGILHGINSSLGECLVCEPDFCCVILLFDPHPVSLSPWFRFPG